MSSILEGIRVLDLALLFPGSYCSMLLADMGAEIIRVERFGDGGAGGLNQAFYNSLNRGKKSIRINLKPPVGREIFYRLVKDTDALLEGFRPGVTQRLGIDYQTLRAHNPKLIYCSITGYGQEGPYKALPGHDINYQAIAGVLGIFKVLAGEPIKPPLALSDISAAMFAALAVVAALYRREKDEVGQYIDISMLDGLLSWMSTFYCRYVFGNEKFPPSREPAYGIFKTQDGKYITLGVAFEDWFWRELCQAIGLEDMAGADRKQRIENVDDYTQRIRAQILKHSREEWVKILKEADVPVAPLYEFFEVPQDPQVKHRGCFFEMEDNEGGGIAQIASPIKFSRTPVRYPSSPPLRGGDTEPVLAKFGYTREEIEKFKKEGII